MKLRKKRQNKAIWAKVECRETGKDFCLGVYHMPCEFRTPLVMNMHAALCLGYMQEKSGNSPLILGGDFNFGPSSFAYRVITKGIVDKATKDLLSRELVAMKSAYETFLGDEPDFTNFSWSKPRRGEKDEGPFIGCLDYIFLSPQFDVVDVLELQHRKDSSGPFPNAVEPSDHILIATTLHL